MDESSAIKQDLVLQGDAAADVRRKANALQALLQQVNKGEVRVCPPALPPAPHTASRRR